MTVEQFETNARQFLSAESDVLSSKGIEYSAGDNDRLKTFKDIASIVGLEAKDVCMVFLLKHIMSLSKYVSGNAKPTTESFEERVHDARNYLLFLAMLHREEDTKCLKHS